MQIRDMFLKSIERDVKGVIKVGQDDDANVKQELEEYVVTRELQKHFSAFFENYVKSINGETDKMGVWISGFFGSGKSHFLKILSYLLENKEVEGKQAIDYFKDSNKISDSMVIGNMELAGRPTTDVILFNIDSKSNSMGKDAGGTITSVFLNVFNEMQGFCSSDPHLADLERQLENKGKYDEFKNEFKQISGEEWEEGRHLFTFMQEEVIRALTEIGFMKEDAARNWCAKSAEPYQISIENFARMVKKYIDRQGNNHHVVFLVDEMGQYIGGNSKIMLNLQTITEDLGTQCKGKAWVVATSQEAIDSVVKIEGDDFSKILGRFDTRLSLSAADVDEVIRKRILEKKKSAAETLNALYEERSTVIKNLIAFADGIEKKLYRDSEDFASVYPFVPYQFDLVGDVLTEVRNHGASGKHLAEGARSMLALFKESAEKIKNEEQGEIVPFWMFYDALERWLDHDTRDVISKAYSNGKINPKEKEDCFNVNVLKSLFLIKYLKNIEPTIENIVSLMVTNVKNDRIKLKTDVEEALKLLTGQTLVQKNASRYMFQTNAEQDIVKEIKNQEIGMSEVMNKISEIIFDSIYTTKKYTTDKFGSKYSFDFNQKLDDKPYKNNQNNDISLNIITPSWGGSRDETSLKMTSGQENQVLVVLPNDSTFREEVRTAMQIEKYLHLNFGKSYDEYAVIIDGKGKESKERLEHAKAFLTEAIEDSKIYVKGSETENKTSNINEKIGTAFKKIVALVFNKLSYIDSPKKESDIREMLSDHLQGQFSIESNKEDNKNAIDDVRRTIESNSYGHFSTPLKELIDRYTKAPYGFMETDVEWIVAKLFKSGEICLYMNSESVSLVNRSIDDIMDYLLKSKNHEKLIIKSREKIDDKVKQNAKDVMKELFGKVAEVSDDDSIMKSFIDAAKEFDNELRILEKEIENQPKYPGKNIVESGRGMMTKILQANNAAEFFALIDSKKNDYFNFSDGYGAVKSFFEDKQKQIFDKAIIALDTYEKNKSFMQEKDFDNYSKEIREIVYNPKPFGMISKLPDIIERFDKKHGAIMQRDLDPVIKAIEASESSVIEKLSDKAYKESIESSAKSDFEDLREKARECIDIGNLKGIKTEADHLKIIYLNRINSEEEKGRTDADQERTIRQKTISIKSINIEQSWQLKTEADVEKYIKGLEKKLIEKLEDDTIINIEF